MYTGFNLHLEDFFDDGHEYYGKVETKTVTNDVMKNIARYTSYSGEIHVRELEKEWFPAIECDVFISHSHNDQKLAFRLAGYLFKNFGLKCFIDSGVWGNADELLQNIDDKFCMNDDDHTYSYKKRNRSTSNIHLILIMALAKMIDHSECVIFINTPNSVATDEVIRLKTKSPWIYSELLITQIIEKKHPVRYATNVARADKSESVQSLGFIFDSDVTHLTPIESSDIQAWKIRYENTTKYQRAHPLDILYRMKSSTRTLIG